MLDRLQDTLDSTYRLDGSHDVRDFLVTDPAVARCLGPSLAGTDETLFICEDDEGVAMSLFLDQAMLSRLETLGERAGLDATSIDDFWKVIEGLSHFNCVAFKANRDREVSLLELELQGEIDKYVISLLLALEHDDRAFAGQLHAWLFEDVDFHADLTVDEFERYRAANDMAARFCFRLRDALLHRHDGAFDELRTFYRLPISDKISHITSAQL